MSNNKQQTAVEWIAERTFNLIELMKRKWVNQEEFLDGMLKARNEAKEMEMEQKANTWNNAINAVEKDKWESFEQYYNETYGGNK
jgi:hypothetical protein